MCGEKFPNSVYLSGDTDVELVNNGTDAISWNGSKTFNAWMKLPDENGEEKFVEMDCFQVAEVPTLEEAKELAYDYAEENFR